MDQTIYLGGFNTGTVFSHEAYALERGNSVVQNPIDGITRTTSWTGKVGLIYPSDLGYAADLSLPGCQRTLDNFGSCSANWMSRGASITISPSSESSVNGFKIDGKAAPTYLFSRDDGGNSSVGGWPVLTLNPDVYILDGDGSKENPYVIGSSEFVSGETEYQIFNGKGPIK